MSRAPLAEDNMTRRHAMFLADNCAVIQKDVNLTHSHPINYACHVSGYHGVLPGRLRWHKPFLWCISQATAHPCHRVNTHGYS